MIPALLAVGAGISMYNQFQANMAQAKAEIDNARFFEVQAAYAREAASREAMLSRRKFSFAKGAQVGAFAKGNISVTEGSSTVTLANTLARELEELSAIRTKGAVESNLALGRAEQAKGVARTLRDPLYNLTQAGSTALTAYALGT